MKVCSCVPVLNFLRLMPIGDITKCRSPKKAKMAKIGVFRRHRTTEYTDRDEISQVNVDRGYAIAHQIWPSSVKGGRCRSYQQCQNLPKMVGFGHRKPTQRTHLDAIWPVSVDLGSALAHQIWPSSVKGGRCRSPPNMKNCPKFRFFGHRKPTQ